MSPFTIDSPVQNIARSTAHEDERLRSYLVSPECTRVLDVLLQQPYVDYGRLQQGLDILEGVSADSFHDVCHAVFHCLRNEWVTEKGTNYPSFYVDYQGVRFHTTLRKSPSYWTTREELLAKEGQRVS